MENITFGDRVRIDGYTTAVGPDVTIGSGSLVLPGAQLSEGVVIHARSVVIGLLPAWTICGGNPAVPIGNRSRQLLDRASAPRDPSA